jgi:hypothetical protein
LNLRSCFIIFTYVQGPVGTERNQDGCSWLPGGMMRLEPANTQGTSRMGCEAALGGGQLAAHQILAFLGKKTYCLVQDFHPDWIARLNGLPVSDGLHNQSQSSIVCLFRTFWAD